MKQRKITLGYLSIADVGPLQIVEAAAEAGFSSVGIRVCGRRPSDIWQPDVVGSVEVRRAIKSTLKSTGLRLSNISAFHLYPDISVEHLLPVVDVSAELGAEYIVACSYHEEAQQAIDFLGRYSEIAADHGLRLALEVVSYSRCSSLSQAEGIIEQVGSPALGYLLDILHLTRGASDLERIARIPSDQICFAQVCDAFAELPPHVDAATEAKSMRLYPGEGELDLERFMTAIDSAIELEIEVPAQEHRHLSAPERARILHTRMMDFLNRKDVAGGVLRT